MINDSYELNIYKTYCNACSHLSSKTLQMCSNLPCESGYFVPCNGNQYKNCMPLPVNIWILLNYIPLQILDEIFIISRGIELLLPILSWLLLLSTVPFSITTTTVTAASTVVSICSPSASPRIILRTGHSFLYWFCPLLHWTTPSDIWWGPEVVINNLHSVSFAIKDHLR